MDLYYDGYTLSPSVGGVPLHGGAINWGSFGSKLNNFGSTLGNFGSKVGSSLGSAFNNLQTTSFYKGAKEQLKNSDFLGKVGSSLSDLAIGSANIGLEIAKLKAEKAKEELLKKALPEEYAQKEELKKLQAEKEYQEEMAKKEKELAKQLKIEELKLKNKLKQEEAKALKRKAEALQELANKPKKLKLSEIQKLTPAELANYAKYYGTDHLPEDEPKKQNDIDPIPKEPGVITQPIPADKETFIMPHPDGVVTLNPFSPSNPFSKKVPGVAIHPTNPFYHDLKAKKNNFTLLGTGFKNNLEAHNKFLSNRALDFTGGKNYRKGRGMLSGGFSSHKAVKCY